MVLTIFFAQILAGFISGLGSAAFAIGALITAPAMAVGMCVYLIAVWRDDEYEISKIFRGFDNLGRNIGGVLLVQIYTTLWMLLFIIPGIIMGLAYSMTNYIMADTACTAGEAIRTSKAITKGHRWEIFVMGLSFFGWYLLGALTAGLALIYAIPYMAVSYAGLYEELKKNAIAKGVWQLSE
jgi:uncharacterized membrane protein